MCLFVVLLCSAFHYIFLANNIAEYNRIHSFYVNLLSNLHSNKIRSEGKALLIQSGKIIFINILRALLITRLQRSRTISALDDACWYVNRFNFNLKKTLIKKPLCGFWCHKHMLIWISESLANVFCFEAKIAHKFKTQRFRCYPCIEWFTVQVQVL